MTSSQRATEPESRRRPRGHAHYGAVIWIALLLASWFVIAEWHVLPELINHTMAALP